MRYELLLLLLFLLLLCLDTRENRSLGAHKRDSAPPPRNGYVHRIICPYPCIGIYCPRALFRRIRIRTRMLRRATLTITIIILLFVNGRTPLYLRGEIELKKKRTQDAMAVARAVAVGGPARGDTRGFFHLE